MRYRAFITGGGSNLGRQLVDRLLESNYTVDTISSKEIDIPNVNSIKVSWYNANYSSLRKAIVDLTASVNRYDLIILNHNSGCMYSSNKYAAMNKEDHINWSREFFLSCQTYDIFLKYLKHTTTKSTKILALASGVVENPFSDVSVKYTGYTSIKSSIIYMMKAYSKTLDGIYTVMNPGHMENEEQYKDNSYSIISTLLRLDESYNGAYISINGRHKTYTI